MTPWWQVKHPEQQHSERAPSRWRAGVASQLGLVLAAAVGLVAWAAGPELALRRVQAIEPETQLATGSLWGRASFPVENFQAYTSPFGYRSDPYGGGQRFHYGLDLAAPSGSYIRNWWTGYVLWVSDDSACGTAVAIQSGEWTHIYCHMHGHTAEDGQGRYFVDSAGGLQLWEGQSVAAGVRIGRVGMTGRTTGPHLHWGLKYQGNWVDPALVLQAMYDSQRAALNPR